MMQQVAQPDRRRAEQVAEHAEQVAVAAAVVRDRLDADLLLDEHARQQRAHAALRARAVGHVHRIDARVLELRARRASMRVASTPRGGTISTDVTNSSARDLRRPARALGERHRRRRRLRSRCRVRRVGAARVRQLIAHARRAAASRGASGRMPSTIAWMCSGVVPQQPPTIFAPACTRWRA